MLAMLNYDVSGGNNLPFSSLKKSANAVLEVLRQSILLSLTSTHSKAVRQVHKSPATRVGHLRAVLQPGEESLDEDRQVQIGMDRRSARLANLSESVGRRVLDHQVLIIHHGNEDRQSLLHKVVEELELRAVQNSAKCSNGGFPLAPILMANVGLNERENIGNNVTSNALSIEPKTLVGGTGGIILVIGGILILVGKELEEDGDDLASSDAGKVPERAKLGDTFGGELYTQSASVLPSHLHE